MKTAISMPHSNRASRLAGASRGSAAIEFAILLPFLIMVLVGIIDVNLIFYDDAVITNAARAGARAGAVLQVPPLTTSQIASITTAYAQNSLVTGGSATSPTVTVTQSNGTASGSSLQVAVSYTYHGLLLGSKFSALVGPVVVNATAVMIYE
jgi:Flp pilus assembly protein TadG